MKKISNKSLFWLLLLLSFLVLVQQFLSVILQYKAIFNQAETTVSKYLQYVLKTQHIDIWPFVLFIFAHLFLIVILSLIIYFVAIACVRLFKREKWLFLFGLLLWFVTLIFILTANSYYFPHSIFATGWAPLLNIIVMLISGGIVLISVGCALLAILLYRKDLWLLLIVMLAVGFFSPVSFLYHNPKAKMGKSPNVIIIGLDSIRPDFTSFYGNKNIKTPNIDQFLGGAVNFTQAYSALARTYVAWNSILSGKYPIHDHVRDNLIDPDTLNLRQLLTTKLHAAGYETIFATDSRQFSIINKQFGFDEIISPKMGIYDFIFCLFNDFPLSNLIMNSRLGEMLFPYNYANRMAFITYRPETFVNLLNRKLIARGNKPLFLGMHLILTHWPFVWANDQQQMDLPEVVKYGNSVEAIDKQFGMVMHVLRRQHLLNHAIVILLSDHGLGLGLPGDRVINRQGYIGDKKDLAEITLYPYSSTILRGQAERLGLDTSSGEGTDVLGFNVENRIILAVKTYGFAPAKKNISYPVSLIDLAPTILDLLQLKPLANADGISLKELIIGDKTKLLSSRPLFFETGLWMPLFSINDLKNGIAAKYLLKKLTMMFEYDKKLQTIIFKNSALPTLLSSKQRAILYGDWLLALYPKALNVNSVVIAKNQAQKANCDFQQTNGNQQIICYHFTQAAHPFYVLANIKSHQWEIGLNSKLTKQAPLKIMWQKLHDFYQNEINSWRNNVS